MSTELTDRQRRILARLVSDYIEQGEPVSSAWLAEHAGLGLSSATVRNILARLEELGLVRQPHTSAGRVPTDAGYRLYVDALLQSRRRVRSGGEFESRLRRSGTVGDLLENVSQELARASHQIAFALTPASPTVRLRHIDFVNLDSRRVLVIVVATGNQVTHKVVDTPEPYDAAVLQQAANYINSEFTGLTLLEAREALVARMREERLIYDELLSRALRLAQTGLDEVTPEETVFVQGASFLFDSMGGSVDREQVTLDTLRTLFQLLEEKHRLVELLTSYIESDGLTVVIGSEHLNRDMHPFSLVASTFNDGQRSGTVGVIGPTRMRYQRAITIVDGVSRAVTRVLEEQKES
jgi:heat-inducible transcriptional repressor